MEVALLLSGGVDSSVALHRLKQAGHQVTAFYLKIWLEDELAFLGDCPWEDDLKYARAVCAQAGVPLRIVALQTEYQERVVSYALTELKAGRTPSPDILCNSWIKFGLFLEKIEPTFEKIASGHYARVEERSGQFNLLRSPDPVKDQTYFLSRLTQTQLSRILFPIGHLTKTEVREQAHALQLPNRDRRDSQGICFLGKIKYPEFVRFHLGEKKGEVVNIETGEKLAEHQGVWFHTVGQRKGLGMGGGPWYVVKKDLPSNVVYVAHSENYLQHARLEFTVSNVHWTNGEPAETVLLEVKVRHSPRLEKCRLSRLTSDRWQVSLQEKDQGIASGQSAVFYDGQCCLGSGVID
ncbi:MAG TPA: tRNA 2-thiouridine(34) synthase MnmA [Verrucomicrobiae bacterium]|nr:tRNA 2-thiouridine(34) synthase MnmA [Verrucomicrobiae bacterium]